MRARSQNTEEAFQVLLCRPADAETARAAQTEIYSGASYTSLYEDALLYDIIR